MPYQTKLTRFVHTLKSLVSPDDGICGRTLQYCAHQLSGVFRYLFQTSVDTATIPTIWKTSMYNYPHTKERRA